MAPMRTVTMSPNSRPALGPIPSGRAELPRRNRTPVSERNLIHDEARSGSGSALASRQLRWFFASARSRPR
jgi:hypothetical protein